MGALGERHSALWAVEQPEGGCEGSHGICALRQRRRAHGRQRCNCYAGGVLMAVLLGQRSQKRTLSHGIVCVFTHGGGLWGAEVWKDVD